MDELLSTDMIQPPRQIEPPFVAVATNGGSIFQQFHSSISFMVSINSSASGILCYQEGLDGWIGGENEWGFT